MFNYAKLEACIKQSGKTKTYLCKQLGRPPYYLRDVLRQKNIIPEEYQAILADELGVTVAFLNDAETESNSHKAQKNIPTPEGEDDPLRVEISEALSDMSNEQLVEVLRYMKYVANRED